MKTVASIVPIIAWPWRLRSLGPGDRPIAGACIDCGRDVAVPGPCRALCIYCGMTRGIVALEDKPLE